MRYVFTILAVFAGLILVTGCDRSGEQNTAKHSAAAKPADSTAAQDIHEHDDGSAHADHDADAASDDAHGHEHEGEDAAHGHEHVGEMGDDHEHAHDEVSLGTVTIGDMKVELAQGHGKVEAGKESHLVVKLPYNDKGATVVRAWIGTDDRTMSLVGKGEYAPSHDDYDVHAMAPDPLPEDVMWWIEIEKPDGTKTVGSAKPLK